MTFQRILASALLLCATADAMARPPIQTLLPNTISIEPAPGTGAAATDPVFAAAVDDALAAQGFTTLQQPGHARLVAQLKVTRTQVGTTATNVPVDGPSFTGGGTRGVGGGVSLNLPTGKVRNVPLVQTRLEVRVSRRGEPGAAWESSALTVGAASDNEQQEQQLASKLATALFAAREGEGAIAVP